MDTATASTTAQIEAGQAERKRQIALIHIAYPSLGWTRAQYVAHLMGTYGVDSCSALSNAQRDELMGHFKALGFKVKPNKPTSGAASGQANSTRKVVSEKPLARKLRAIWYAMADVSAVQRPLNAAACDNAVNTWAKQELPALTHLRFATDAQLVELVERMKAWGRRVGAQVF